MAIHSSILAGKFQRQKSPSMELESMESQRVGHDWGTHQAQDIKQEPYKWFSIFESDLGKWEHGNLIFKFINDLKTQFWLKKYSLIFSNPWSPQFSSFAQSCPALCNPVNCSTPGFPVLLEFAQIHVHQVWCHPTISSSVALFSSCPQPFSASGSCLVNWVFTPGGQSIGASASASVLSTKIQDEDVVETQN